MTQLAPEYHNFILKSLNRLPSNYVMQFIKVSERFLMDMRLKAFPMRTEFRRAKSDIDTDAEGVLLLSDLSISDLNVEIKPKWSGLKHIHSDEEVCSCRYCLAQISKRRRDFPCSPGKLIYCPILLFSTSKSKISAAVEDLFSNPSNQLRVFSKSFLFTLQEMQARRVELLPLLTEIVSSDTIFQNIIEFQLQLLEGIDLESLLSTQNSMPQYLADLGKLNEFKSIDSIPDYLRVLICMTIRDSSIMISIDSNDFGKKMKAIVIENSKFYYRIEPIDFDIKSIDNLPRYVDEIRKHG